MSRGMASLLLDLAKTTVYNFWLPNPSRNLSSLPTLVVTEELATVITKIKFSRFRYGKAPHSSDSFLFIFHPQLTCNGALQNSNYLSLVTDCLETGIYNVGMPSNIKGIVASSPHCVRSKRLKKVARFWVLDQKDVSMNVLLICKQLTKVNYGDPYCEMYKARRVLIFIFLTVKSVWMVKMMTK